MYMISEQVKEIRNMASVLHEEKRYAAEEIMRQAADTIEALSAKLQEENVEQSDMISRNKLIEEIDKEIDGVIVKDTYSKGKNAGLRKAKILAEEQIVTHYSGGWISCEDRFPDKTGTYLTTSRIYFVPDHVDEPDNYIGVEMTRFSEKFGWNGEEVLAWQPLPEPYRP